MISILHEQVMNAGREGADVNIFYSLNVLENFPISFFFVKTITCNEDNRERMEPSICVVDCGATAWQEEHPEYLNSKKSHELTQPHTRESSGDHMQDN